MKETETKTSRWKRFDQRLGYLNNIAWKLGLWILIFTGLTLLWKEYHSDQFLISPIEVPTAFENQGIKPLVAAQRIYDEINRFQQNVSSVREASGFSTQQRNSNVDFQVAGFGLSVQSLANQMRNAMGKLDQTIRGEIIEGQDSVSLRLRYQGAIISNIKEKLNVNREKALEALAIKAAEKIFSETEPYLYAVHISNTKTPDESLPFAKKLLTIPEEKKWGLNLMGNIYRNDDQNQKAIEFYKKAEKEDPEFALAKRNLAYAYKALDSIDLAIDYFNKAIPLSEGGNLNYMLAEQFNLLQKYYPEDPRLVHLDKRIDGIGNSEFYSLIAINLVNNSNFSEGYYWAKKSLAIDPENEIGLNACAMLACAFQEIENCDKYISKWRDFSNAESNILMVEAIQAINKKDLSQLNHLIDTLISNNAGLKNRGDFKAILGMQHLLNGDTLQAKEAFFSGAFDPNTDSQEFKKLKFMEPLFVFLPDSLQ